jgi:hypothetical protein
LLSVMRSLGLATIVPQTDPLHGARLFCGECIEVIPTLPINLET